MDNLTKYINKYGKISKCGPFEYYRVEPATDYRSSYLALGWDDNGEGDWKEWYLEIPRLISKEYGFIKRLVDNDKIDESKIFCDQGLYYSLLCKLAISDTPIDDLISYLK